MPRARAPHWAGRRLSVLAVTVAVSLTAGASCSSSEPGLEVDVALAPPASPALQDGARHFTSDQGYDIVVTRGYLAIGSVELLPCATAARRLPFGVGVAHAHSLSSPTRLGDPGVVSLGTPADDELLLGTLKPPPGEYCGVRVGLEPADEDAAGLPSELDMVGLTLHLQGSYRKDATEGDFVASTGSEVDAHVPLSTLSLEEGGSHARLTLGSNGERWFDGIDFEAASSAEITEKVLDNVQKSLAVSSR